MKTLKTWLPPNLASETVLLCLLLSAQVANPTFAAQEISRSTVDAGGGSSQESGKRITGTIGQPSLGVHVGDLHRVQGGFWPGVRKQIVPTETETPTPSSTPSATPTTTPTATATTVEPTRTFFDFDVQPDPLDGFIDARDLIEWIDRTRGSNGDLDVLFEFSLYWRTEYPPSRKDGAGTE